MQKMGLNPFLTNCTHKSTVFLGGKLQAINTGEKVIG
jgi:hypothetical protein